MKKIINIAIIQCILIVAGILFSIYAFAQNDRRTVKLAANAEYDKAGKFKRFMLGEHYRKEWATAVDIEILDMDVFAGGLTPLKMGGGMQTKSLRLQGADGKEYVLRSVNKDASKAIFTELRGTFAEDVVQDQISSANPYAPMVVASLEEAAGIFHTHPKLVYVEKSSRLGEYANAFGGTLCLLEERPSGNEENNPAFDFSKNVINSQKLAEKIFSNSDHRVNARSFLKARLFDMLIGDWDRHADQWLWAAFKDGDKTFYKPIPRDRDQAFAKMDGVIPEMTTKKWAMRHIQGFDYTIHDLNGLNKSGGYLDRLSTTQLTLNEWQKVAGELQDAITDKAIADAFREMPDAIYNISGKKTVAMLKQRRDDLKKYATSYYKFLSEQVDVTGTKAREIFEVTRINDDSTSVVVYKDGSNSRYNRIIFERTFLRSETKEIRLYGLGDNDIFTISGKTSKGITVRIIGGNGVDSVTDNSLVNGLTHKTKIYDDKNNAICTGSEARKFLSNDSLKNDYHFKSFKFDWVAPVLSPGYNPDDGFFVGGGIAYKKQRFGKAPYGQMHLIAGNYSFATGAYSVWYKGTFPEFIGKADLNLSAKYNSPTYVRNFYGLGNETINREDVSKDYYRVRMSQLIVSSGMSRRLGKYHTLAIGNEFQSVKLQQSEDRYTGSNSSKLDSTDYDRKNYLTSKLSYQFNKLDNELYPRKGVKFEAGASYTQNVSDRDKNYVTLHSEAAIYNSKGRFTLASRAGIATNVGNDYEFYQANYLGGLTNLRGFRKERFAGKTSVYQTTELRVSIGSMNAYFVKGMWGVLAFADHGRVWMPNEDSDTWHHGYGGGLWFLPFNKMAMTATYGVSKEDRLLSITAGFLF